MFFGKDYTDEELKKIQAEGNRRLQKKIQEYIENPDTRVFIDFNRDLGYPMYAVIVADSEDFWLDAFKTEQKARNYIAKHNLKMTKEDYIP